MDPQATWDQLLEASVERDFDRMEELAEALLQWMERRGGPPKTVNRDDLPRGWHKAIAQFVCYMAKSDVARVKKRRSRRTS
jgi:hypothetical protein